VPAPRLVALCADQDGVAIWDVLQEAEAACAAVPARPGAGCRAGRAFSRPAPARVQVPSGRTATSRTGRETSRR